MAILTYIDSSGSERRHIFEDMDSKALKKKVENAAWMGDNLVDETERLTWILNLDNVVSLCITD